MLMKPYFCIFASSDLDMETNRARVAIKIALEKIDLNTDEIYCIDNVPDYTKILSKNEIPMFFEAFRQCVLENWVTEGGREEDKELLLKKLTRNDIPYEVFNDVMSLLDKPHLMNRYCIIALLQKCIDEAIDRTADLKNYAVTVNEPSLKYSSGIFLGTFIGESEDAVKQTAETKTGYPANKMTVYELK